MTRLGAELPLFSYFGNFALLCAQTQWDTPDGNTKVELGHRNLEITALRFILNSGTGCKIIANDIYVPFNVLKVALTGDSLYVTIAVSIVLKSVLSRTNYPIVCTRPTQQGFMKVMPYIIM
jgi:hypothetical protein